jgi:hypothetical protein
MRLIGLAVILVLNFILAPFATDAQQAAKVPRIGILSNATGPVLPPNCERPSFKDCVSLDMSRARTSFWSPGMPGDGLNGSPTSQLS